VTELRGQELHRRRDLVLVRGIEPERQSLARAEPADGRDHHADCREYHPPTGAIGSAGPVVQEHRRDALGIMTTKPSLVC
jgi:hypothetical protein